jgi:hypothetical protein
MNPILWWTNHGTKILGAFGTAIPGLIAIDGLIPKTDVKYWLAADLLIGVFTFGRGFTTSRNQQENQQ